MIHWILVKLLGMNRVECRSTDTNVVVTRNKHTLKIDTWPCNDFKFNDVTYVAFTLLLLWCFFAVTLSLWLSVVVTCCCCYCLSYNFRVFSFLFSCTFVWFLCNMICLLSLDLWVYLFACVYSFVFPCICWL